MKPKLIIILALIVLAPLTAALWLGAQVVRDERRMLAHRIQQLMLAELRAVDQAVARSLAEVERLVVAEMEPLTTDRETLRRRSRESPYVRQFYVFDATDGLLHPPLVDLESLTRRELQALERTGQIWLDGDLSSPRGGDEAGSSRGEPAGGRERGWHVWYWGDGLQMMLWLRDGDRLHVAELNRVRLLAEIIAGLPETDPLAELPEGRIRLVATNGAPLYQWGSYEPPGDERPVARLALGAPLGGWGLEYLAAEEVLGAALEGSVLLNALIGLFVLAATVCGLAYYFYREQSRETREAAQRVSFVNQVSHELKTPLTNIRMYAELMESELSDRSEPPARHLAVIVSESQRLSRLIGNILTFSRKQRHTLGLHRSPGVVDEVLRETLDLFAPALEAKSVAVRFEPGAGETVSFDRDALEQIVGNLVGNVEKYGAGRMVVSSRLEGETVTITVGDDGPGIARSEREKIFRPFYRVRDSLTEGVSGSGIGLAVARDLARLHGGDLVLEDSSAGARFRLTLRCPPAAQRGEA